MIKYIAVIFLSLCSVADAQLAGGLQFPNPGIVHSTGGGGYVGPGDVVSGALAWGGLRAYSAANAGTKAANICNAADANCADVNTLANGNFDVATAQGAPLNCGGAGGTCTVKILYDQTGNTNCAATACDLTHVTISARATLSFSCTGLSAGLPCMTFNGTSHHLQSANAITQAQPWTISSLFNTSSIAATEYPITIDSGAFNGGVLQMNSAPNITPYAGNSFVVTAVPVINTWYASQWVGNGASCAFYINGSTNSGNCGTNGFSNRIDLGGFNGSQLFVGTQTEYGIWGAAFNGTQQANMNSNQRTYWGF